MDEHDKTIEEARDENLGNNKIDLNSIDASLPEEDEDLGIRRKRGGNAKKKRGKKKLGERKRLSKKQKIIDSNQKEENKLDE